VDTPAWTDQAVGLNEFKIELRVRAFESRTAGLARVFTNSASQAGARNVTIAQHGPDLFISLRRRATANRFWNYTICDVFNNTLWRKIELRLLRQTVTVEVDEKVVVTERVCDNALASWNRTYPLVLGNELTGDFPWRGEISYAAVTVGDCRVDYLKPGAVHIPSSYWHRPWVQSLDEFMHAEQTGDYVLNFTSFIPIGFVLAGLGGLRGSLVFAVVTCAIASVGVEIAQICFEHRCSSFVDLGLNVVGATAGAIVARLLFVGLRRGPSIARTILPVDLDQSSPSLLV
jgi:hypothetical protein